MSLELRGAAAAPAALLTATKTGAYGAVAGDVVPVDASGGAVTITLPASAAAGTIVTVKKVDGTPLAVTVVPSGADTIDGLTSMAWKTRGVSRVFLKGPSTDWVVTGGLTTTQGADNARYNRLTGVYIPNDNCLLNYRKAIQRARHGGSTLRAACRVLARGDSTTYGVISGLNPLTEVRKDYNWVARAQALLPGLLPGVVSESIMTMPAVDDSRFTYAGGASGQTLGNGQSMIFTDGAGHDAYDVCLLRNGGAGTSLVVSGAEVTGSPLTIDLSGAPWSVAPYAGTFRIPMTDANAHEITINGPAAGTMSILNLEPITLATPPIVKLGGHGSSGMTLATLNPSVTGSGSVMAGILRPLPDLVFLFLGVNDMIGSSGLAATAATYKTNLDAFATAFQAQGGDVVFIVPPSYNANAHSLASAYESVLFHQAIYEVAESKGCAVIDIQRRWGYGVTPTTGYATSPGGTPATSAMYDGVHMTVLGYRDIGRAIAGFLADAAG